LAAMKALSDDWKLLKQLKSLVGHSSPLVETRG
jgi:hypothetical protein